MATILLYGVALVLGAVRIGGCVAPAFQAIAHLFVGGLIGAGLATPRDSLAGSERREGYLVLALAVSLLELGCFIVQRLF